MIFDYFKKFIPKKTNFDMSNHSPYTAKIGELLPTYVNDVMAGDDWTMRIKESIKTAPLDVPSFLRISNSSHGFFVPNSTIWEHWNDFVTNGSMIQDVILTANQKNEVASRFKVPSIPANLLQIPLKIANGWACPFYTFSKNNSSSRLLGAANGITNPNSSTTTKPKQYFLPSVTTDCDVEELLVNANIPSINIFDGDSLVATCYQVNEESMSLMESFKPHSDSGLFTFADYKASNYLRWICFQDEFSATCDITDCPVEYTEFDRVFYNSRVTDTEKFYSPFRVKCGDYRIKDTWLSKDMPSALRTDEYVLSNDDTFENDVKSVLFGDTPFIGSIDVSIMTLKVGTIRNVGVKTFFTSFSEFKKYLMTEVNNFAHDRSLTSDGLSVALSFNDKTGNVVGDAYCSLSYRSVPVDKTTTSYLNSNCLMRNSFTSNGDYFFDLPFPAFGGSMADIIYKEDSPVPRGNTDYTIQGKSFVFDAASDANVSDCLACGYSPTAWVHYLCCKVSRLVDFMDINVDGLVVRGYLPYIDVFYNALPFMAYSKIWHTYYRNSQIQSPELCYKDANGPLYLNAAHNNEALTYGIDIGNTTDETNFYYVNNSTDFTGWYLTIHNKPLEMVGGYAAIRIDSLAKAFTLITGCCMTSLISNLTDKAFDGVFLPSYYNSLCGVKYKNIGKSIFTSSMLEPTNGAKIEEIPDTVLELRFSEKLQQFWERTAVARTFKKWSQTIFGTTPSHDDYDEPLLLGKATSDVQIGEILQQSQTTDTAALGQRAGVAVGGCKKGVSSHYFNEHGFVMILSSFTMEVEFCDGEQGYTHATRSYLDIPYTQFASIGNESIPNRLLSAVPPPSQLLLGQNVGYLPEHFADCQYYGSQSSILGNAAMLNTTPTIPTVIPSGVLNSWQMSDLPVSDTGVINTSAYLDKPFAYTSRYADKKIKLDRCHGEFRNQLSHWVAFQRMLGAVGFTHFFCTWEFKADNNDLARYFVVNDEDMFQIDRYNECNVKRALPYSSRPQ